MLPLTTMLVLGPYSMKKLGKFGATMPEVGPGVAVPLLVQVDTVATGDAHRREEARGLEAGAVDDDVGIVRGAVGQSQACRADLRDWLGDQVHVVALQGRRPDAVVADDPLGCRWIVGHHLVEQVGPITEAQPDVHPQQHA